MADPVSIAGIAIAVLEDLIKLGVWTANLVENVRAFEEDTRNLVVLIESDTSRTKLLKALLFARLPTYGDRTLFDQFSDDVQRQTSHLLEDSKSTLQAAYDLLARRYAPKSPATPTETDSSPLSPTISRLSLLSTPSYSSRSRSSSSLTTAILWSVRDKKRVEGILHKFNELNVRVEKNVKLWCLANDLGVNIEHLQRLQHDESSKKLGFDIDATLRLAQQDAQISTDGLMLDVGWDQALTNFKHLPRTGPFYEVERKGDTYILEHHAYDPPIWMCGSNSRLDVCGLDSRTKNRVEALAKLLHQPKELIFRIPPCVGWRYLPEHHAVSFVFEIKPKPAAPPKSLLELLSHREQKSGWMPSLGERFQLAAALSSCIAQLHMVSWLHESLRSENILFFPDVDPMALSANDTIIDFSSPWIFGFEFSRLDVAITAAHVDFLPERDIYRHPQRQGYPEVTFQRIHDIYSLGVILLEIGLWEPAIKLQKNSFLGANPGNFELIQQQLLKHATHRLEKRVGKRYKDVVIRCLKGDFGVTNDNREDLKLQQAFRAQVVDVLERAASSV
ncbi:hypothetical protein LTS15_010159 [Exophiala xenobiotica]|nr:hypothetical protein LTS15_010159 [Exophiala xenobiotica]